MAARSMRRGPESPSRSRFQTYLLPGFVFQSVVIAGGYGTGRELVEFFLRLGPAAGLAAMAVATVIWSAVCASSFEFARRFQLFDYRSFFLRLLGRAGFLYEILYLAHVLLVLAVIAAAAGAIVRVTLGWPGGIGVVSVMAAVGYLALGGTPVIERFLASWSLILYGVYMLFFGWCLSSFGPDIVAGLGAMPAGSPLVVLRGGVEYAAYNLALIPAILFVVRHSDTRHEAVVGGLLAGPVAMIPGLLFYLAMVGHYPEVLGEEVPASYLLSVIGSRPLQLAFQLVLFGTLIETGIGLVHGVNERLAQTFLEAKGRLPVGARPSIAIGLIVLGSALARFGIIDLIARGYGTITWFFAAVYVVPILTLGVWKVARATGGVGSAATGGAPS